MDLEGMKRRELQALCKRHGLPAGGTNAALVARLDAALSGAAGAEGEEEVGVGVEARKGCLKQTGGDAAEAKKVTFAVEEGKARRLRSRVIWSPVVARTRGKCADASTDSAADEGVSAKAGADVPVRRSRRNSVSAADLEDVGEAVSVDRKRKRRNQENDEGVAVSTQIGVSSRATRRSSLSATAIVLLPAVQKKRGRGKAADGNELVAEAQDCEPDVDKSAQAAADVPVRRSRWNSLSVAEAEDVGEGFAVDRKRKRKNEENDECVAISAQVGVSSKVTRRSSLAAAVVLSPSDVEKKRGRRKATDGNKLVAKAQDCEPVVDKSAKVEEVSARITRSRSVAPVALASTMVENKKRKTGDAQSNVVLSTVSDAPRNDAPAIRSLRNRVVQVNNSVVEETHSAKQLENKMQPSRPATCRHQQLSSSEEDKDHKQIAAPSKAPLLRRSRRNYSKADNANSKTIKLPEDSNTAQPLVRHNANSEDVEKQPAVEKPVKRSTRKSVVLATAEKEKDIIEEKNPKAHVKRAMRKSIVPVKDIKGIGEEIQNANSEDAVKQPATKGPVRRSRCKSAVSELHEKEENGLIAVKNMESHEGRSSRKPVPVEDIKVGEGIQNAKGKDVERHLVVKQPVRRSSRKSVLPDMFDEENQDHRKMARNENFQSGKCQYDEKQQKEPIRRSRRSVATVLLEEQNNGLSHEEKMSKIPMRRSTRKSVALDAVEKVSMDHTALVVQEQERVAEEGLKLRKQRRSSMELSSSANDSWNTEDFDAQKFRKQQNAQIPNEKDITGANHDKPLRTHQASNSSTSKARSLKGIQTSSPEEVMSSKEASDDMIIREAADGAHKATHEYKESSSRVQEICQVNATKEEFSSGSLLVTVTIMDEICTAQSVHELIPGAESGDNAKESSDNSKQPQEHSDIQAVDSHLSETRNGELDQASCIAELVPYNCVVSEDKALMGEDREERGPMSEKRRVVLEANASESRENNLADVMSTGLYFKNLQHDVDIGAEETRKDVTPLAFPTEEHGEEYPVSPVAVEKCFSCEASACGSAGKPQTGILSDDVHKHLQLDCDVLTKETGVVSEAALLISESDTSPEVHCNAITEESIQAADMAKCPNSGRKGNPLSTSLHLESAADNSINPVWNADKGCSSDGRYSSLGLPFLFAEECKEIYSINVESTAVEVDGGNKPITLATPVFYYVGSDCLENEDMQPTGRDANKKLDVDQGVAEAEVLCQEKSRDQHVPAKTDTKMNMESSCSIAENNASLVVDNLDQQAVIQPQQGDMQEGDLEKPSRCSATPECKHECGLPEETVLSSNKNTGSLSSSQQSPFGLESLFSQESIDESVAYGALASATTHTENGIDESKDCHVNSAQNIHVSEPFSHHDTEEGVSKNYDCMLTSQQDNGMEGFPEANLDEERVLSVFSLDAEPLKEVTSSEEVASKCEGSTKLVHSEDLKAPSEKINANGPDGSAYSISDAVLSSAMPAPANDNYEIFLGSNTDMLHQGHNDRCSDGTEERFASKPWTNDIIEDASAKYIESGVVLLPYEERSNLKDGQLNSKLEGTKVVESGLYFNNGIGRILDNGSVMGIAGEKNPSGSGLSKDSSVEYKQEGFAMETSFDGSSMCGEKSICRVAAIEDPSIDLATPGYKHEGALSEEAARTLKNYAGKCSSNPRELLMDLQSQFSKENIDVSDPHDGLAFPSAENSGDGSMNGEHQVKVHHGSNLSQLGLSDVLDEPIGCSNTEVASEPCTNDMEAAAATLSKCIESGVGLLPSVERSNLNDGQLNPKLESPSIMESGLNWDKDVCNSLDNGSVVVVGGKRTPFGSDLPEGYPTDHCPHQELLDGFSVESSLQGTMSAKKIVSGVAGIGNPSLSLATLDYKHEGALSEEGVCGTKNYTGTCSADPRHLFMELQSLYSDGSTEKSRPQDNLAFPCAESGRDEPVVCHVKKLVDIHVPSEPDTCQGPRQYLSGHEEKESCMSVPMQVKENGGFLRSRCMKDSVMPAHIDLADDAHLIERDIVAAEEVLCEEKEERKSMPTSDSDILHGKSYPNGYADQAACASETQFYHSQKASIFDGQHLGPSSLQLESLDALDNDFLYDKTGVLRQHHKEGYHEHNVVSGICAMSEVAPIKVIETGKAVVTSSLPDEQLNPELDVDEVEKHSLNCEKDTSWILGTASVMSETALLPKDGHIVYCQELELPNDLSSFKFAEESAICRDGSVSRSGICQSRSQKNIDEANYRLSTCDTEVLHQNHKEECNKRNEDKFTPKALENDMSEDAPIEGMGSPIILTSDVGASEMPNEQLNTKMSDESELSISSGKETTENFCSGSVKMDLGPFPEEFHKDSCQKLEISEVLSLPKSPVESANFQYEFVSRSGPCQQCVKESTSMQVTYNIEALNQDSQEYNQNNEDQITPSNQASGVPEAVEIEQSEMETGVVPPAETSVFPVPDEQLNNKLEGNEVEHSCTELLNKDDCMGLPCEDNHPNDLPAPRSPKQFAYFQNDNVSSSVGICQSSRRRGIDELRTKLQNFKVSSTVKGSYIAMSAPRPKPRDSLSQSAIALLRNRENTPAAKAGHPVKPNDRSVTKDSSRRALQPISGRPKEH